MQCDAADCGLKVVDVPLYVKNSTAKSIDYRGLNRNRHCVSLKGLDEHAATGADGHPSWGYGLFLHCEAFGAKYGRT